MSGACRSNEKYWRLWIPALGRSFGAPMADRAISMPENRSFALAARSDSRCRRALHRIHSVVDRMHRPAGPFDRFGRNCPLHGATGMHGTADAARNKQPGEEAHAYPQVTKRPCTNTTLAMHACAWIRQSQATRQTDGPAAAVTSRRIRRPPEAKLAQSPPTGLDQPYSRRVK
jgi:hypothetical protein